MGNRHTPEPRGVGHSDSVGRGDVPFHTNIIPKRLPGKIRSGKRNGKGDGLMMVCPLLECDFGSKKQTENI